MNPLGNTQDVAWGINDSGAIVGWGFTANGQAVHALRWDPGATAATDIGGGGTHSEAYRINNAGAVIGLGYIPVGTSSRRRPVRWAPGATSFEVLPSTVVINGVDYTANSLVHGINDDGVVAGQVQGYSGPLAATWRSPYTDFTMLPELWGQPSTDSTDINAHGMVVGYVSRDSGLTLHGFRYDPATDTISELLGRPGIDPEHGGSGTHPLRIQAAAVNIDGVTVGKAGFIYQEHAVMWLPGSTDAIDLNSLIDPAAGWVLTEAWDINDVGQIIGHARSSSGGGFFVLTPVPEPALLGPALAALATYRRPTGRRRKYCETI